MLYCIKFTYWTDAFYFKIRQRFLGNKMCKDVDLICLMTKALAFR